MKQLIISMICIMLPCTATLAVTRPMSFAANDTTVIKKDSLKNQNKNDATKKKESDYEKLVKKGGSFDQGLFSVRHIEKDWYFEIPEKALGRLFLTVTRFVSVPEGFDMLGGEEVNNNTIYFERYDDKTLLVRSWAHSQTANPNDKIAELVKKSTVDPIVFRLDIIGKNSKTGDMLVNVTKLFKGDNKIAGFTTSDKTQVKVGGLQDDRTFIDTIKTYPINVEVSTLRTYAVTAGKTLASRDGYVTLSLNTSIVQLPEKPMRPRLADERVGYFNNRRVTFSDRETSKLDAIVSRYRLVPKDKKAYAQGKLVEPEKQIVYYIDPATPKEWVPYLIEGINDWNKAFEAAGFKNAIVGKEVPEGSNISPDDARYSFLRYLPSEKENAYGPRIVDPRSGEIIESHICWYHNVMNLLTKWYMTQCGPLDKRAQTMKFDKELMGKLVRFVSSHEVGHTLGLRHNMIASNATPVEKLRDKAWVERYGHTASIMDYARFNYVAQPEDRISESGLFPRINDYDKWAIKWGYQYRPEFSDEFSEKKALRTEVTEALSANKRLRYIGDEGKGADPRSQTEDLGDNSMEASDYGMKNLQRVMQHIGKWTAQPDGQTDDLNTMYRNVRTQFMRYVLHVQRNINGKYINNWPSDRMNDIVPATLQKQAIDWMGRHVFTIPAWLYPDNIVNKLGVDADEEFSSRANTTISYLLSAGALYNCMINSYSATQPYKVDDYLNDVMHAAWKPMSATDERGNNFRRRLEQTYVDFVGLIINPSGTSKDNNVKYSRSDIILYALKHLDTIDDFCNQQLKTVNAAGINAMHYNNLLLKTKKIREKYQNPEE
ncbi:MAG: zinc-dependent metalloprotease [Prevotella sp.]|nr:zinc-dependent metalloprotease [Prevotella sp.]